MCIRDRLIIDDNVSGGDTSTLAKQFIIDILPKAHIRFLPLFFGREEIYDKIHDSILWSRHGFEFPRDRILDIHFVSFRNLPYGKAVSGH